jgi:hypothetical protein
MNLPALQNLVSTAIEFSCPWTYKASIPGDVRGKDGKSSRSDWIQSPSTVHNVYSGWEGLVGNLRISGGPGEGNPPYRLHAVVGDYDAPVSDEELAKGCERMGNHPPAFFERTLSGNARFIWPLESPITVPSREFAIELLKFIQKRLKLDLLTVMLDVPAFLSPERYYTNSCEWLRVSDHRLPANLVAGWVVQVAEKFSFKKTGSVKVPLDVVWPALQKKFPNASWPGDFVEGSQGPSFFIEGSVSPKSALVKPEGLYTFAQHAVKPWWSWSDLLGRQFVEDYETKTLGDAVEDIFFDGKAYWRLNGRKEWMPYMKEDTASHLAIQRGLQSGAPKGQQSEVDRAMEHIRHWNVVNGAAPFVFRPSGMLRVDGQTVLNTFTGRVVSPSEGAPVEWGPGGPMPFLSEYLGGFFDPLEQLPFFLSWLKRFYESAHSFALESGQNLFVVGPGGTGKTLLSTKVLSGLVGGHAVAEDYLMGKTSFNSQLFEAALWTIDDNSATTDAVTHRKFSTIVKRMAANTTFEYHAKFQVPCQVRWQGRVIVTANEDEESIQILPDLDISILDKIMLFRAAARKFCFPPSRELETTIRSELPHLARYLVDFEIPTQCLGENRFGVRSYHESSLVRTAQHSSRTNGFGEILDDWRKDYFEENKNDWTGTAFQLLVALNRDQAKAAAIRHLTADTVARKLSALKNKGYPVSCLERAGGRIWTIPRSATLPPPVVSPPPSGPSRFQK